MLWPAGSALSWMRRGGDRDRRVEEKERNRTMEYADLRDWIDRVDKMGELRTLHGAHWDLEIGAITDVAHHTEVSPAILFDNIAGYPPGKRVLVNVLKSMGRLSFTLGMPGNLKKMEFVAAMRERIHGHRPLPPVSVDSGPVMEKVCTGKDVNVFDLPAPKWHELDGGRYVGTGCVVVTRDPDDGWVNLGTYRVMIQNEDTVGLYISPGKHGRIHREKYFSRGEPLRVAISLGQDPLLFLGACMELPFGISEYDWVGGWNGRPVEVIETEFSGLPIPARAEVVIEGECRPDVLMNEGPFGEFTGYYASAVREEPVVKVRSIFHRRDPILLGYPPTKPPSESSFFFAFYRSALLWDELEGAGVPDVRGVWCHPAGASRMLTIVAIRQRYAGHARQAGLIASQGHANAYLGRFTVVVDEDIDITDLQELTWAITTRCDPETDLEILRRCWSGPLDPIIPKERKGFNSRVVLDACRPYEWMKDFPAVVGLTPAQKEEVMRKWGAKIFDRGTPLIARSNE